MRLSLELKALTTHPRRCRSDVTVAKIMARILSKYAVSSCLQVIQSAAARSFDEGHRFKGAAVLQLVLETVTVNNDSYDVKTSSVSRYLKGKGKRTATLIGGGAGGGALIGGLAGGGNGALIGAALGAGAGTAGAAYTGEKEIVLPAESTLSFKLAEPLTVKM